MKFTRILIFALVLVGFVLLLLGREVSERKRLSEKLQQLQNPPTKMALSKLQPRALEAESSATSLVAKAVIEEIQPEERLKSRQLGSYIDYCRKIDHPVLPRHEFSEEFEANEDLAILFDLSAEKMEALRTQGVRTMGHILAWEVERTEDVSEDENHTELICRIPAGDERVFQIKNEFLTGVRQTIGEDNFSLIEHSLKSRFQPLERERLISVSTSKNEGGDDSYALEVQEFDKRGDVRSGRSRRGLLSHARSPVPKRYAHLFAIDTE